MTACARETGSERRLRGNDADRRLAQRSAATNLQLQKVQQSQAHGTRGARTSSRPGSSELRHERRDTADKRTPLTDTVRRGGAGLQGLLAELLVEGANAVPAVRCGGERTGACPPSGKYRCRAKPAPDTRHDEQCSLLCVFDKTSTMWKQ